MTTPPQLSQKFTLKIEDLGSHGEGVGRFEGYTVFVEGALPEETVEVQLSESHRSYGKAKLLTVLEPSEKRVTPSCPLFEKCGGCQLMHLHYSGQLLMKQQRVKTALQRIGKITDLEVPPCVPSPSPLAYRNKIQLPVRSGEEKILLGMYMHSSHELVEIDSCQIHCELGDKIYREVKTLIQTSTIAAYNPVTGQGELRHLLIKTAVHTKEALVIFVTNGTSNSKFRSLAEQVLHHCPQVKGVVLNVNKKRDNVILGDHYKTLAGDGWIHEKLGDLLFKVSPPSFFQVNPEQAIQLYNKAIEFTCLTGQETILDAYCGVGTLSLFFARHVKHVFGVECVLEAITDAKTNAALNKISNVSFLCSQTETYIKSLTSIDVVILNPPRKGCERIVLQELQRLRPKTIVYISCDPETLARDLAVLKEGYRIDGIQPFDMFPQTAHVECVVKLSAEEK